MIEPKRYKKIEIDKEVFKSFFNECGNIFKQKTITEVSPVWEKNYNEWVGSDVLKHMENGDINSLKQMYEEYYVNGLSEGASSGAHLTNDEYRINKSKRNIERVRPLSSHFDIQESEPFEVYKTLFNKFNICEMINVGQTWGWEYDDIFVHFELADYLYFLDIIINILKEYDLDRTMFIGDGSGVLSSLLYKNFKIKSSHHIDLSHLLLRQYINNYYSDTDVKHHYAENYDVNFKHDTQILINQDSFPEMKKDSVERYIDNVKLNNVPFILSYNIENGQSFNQHHSDYRSVILNRGYNSIWRMDSTLRPPYVFELFYQNIGGK